MASRASCGADGATASGRLSHLYAELGDLSGDFRNRSLYALICSYLCGDSVLDVGSGAGHFLEVARRSGFRVEGVEPDADLVVRSRTLYGDAHQVHRLPAQDVGSIGRTFDNVTMNDVLEHIEDDRSTLRAIRPLLNAGGRLVIVVPQHAWLYGRRDAGIGHFRRYARRDLVSKLADCGYTVKCARSWNVLGIVPYLASEKLLRRPLSIRLRSGGRKGPVGRVTNSLLRCWFSKIENRFSLPWGLSLICVAEPR
jgi:SAM-dependent methyltransferase